MLESEPGSPLRQNLSFQLSFWVFERYMLALNWQIKSAAGGSWTLEQRMLMNHFLGAAGAIRRERVYCTRRRRHAL
jgi:hypothetical protein